MINAKNRAILFVLLASLTLASCSKLASQKQGEKLSIQKIDLNFGHDFLISEAPIGSFGGVLRRTHSGKDPKTFNPWISNDATSSHYAALLFGGLLQNDPDTNKLIPYMAKGYELKNSGKLIIVKLRKDLYWSDGVKITANDVLYTFNTLIRDKVAISSLRDILMVEGEFPLVKKLDDYTVSFETKEIFAPLLETIGLAIAPKHDIEKYFKNLDANTFEEKQKAFNNYLNIETAANEIVSSGMFLLKKITRGERIEFIKNPYFFVLNVEGERLPYVDKLIYSYAPDETAETFKFFAGESHILNVRAEKAALVKSLEETYDYKLYNLGPSSGTFFMWFNLTQNISEPKYSWFNNRNFRKAISYAINRDNIVNNVHQGLGDPLFTPESLQSPFINEKLIKGYKRDLEKSKDLLLKEGFKFDSKGDLYDSKNNRVEFSMYTNAETQTRIMVSTIIVDNLKDIGIKVNFKPLEFNNFVAKIAAGKDYESGILGLTGGNEPNNGANVWRSDGRLHMFDPRTADSSSPIRPWENEIDALFTQGVRTMDFSQRKAIYDKFQEIVYRELPMIYLTSPQSLAATSNKLGNVRKTKYGGLIPNLYEVYIKK